VGVGFFGFRQIVNKMTNACSGELVLLLEICPEIRDLILKSACLVECCVLFWFCLMFWGCFGVFEVRFIGFSVVYFGCL
jgi:hypothetical protein